MSNIKDNVLQWIKELKEGEKCLPHDSYDANCCDGESATLREELIKKLESLF